MRDSNIDRVKRRMLQEAVAENLDVIRGLPPRALRQHGRSRRVWLKRAPVLIVPLILAGSTFMIANGGMKDLQPRPKVAAQAAVLAPPQKVHRTATETQAAPERLTASAFSLSVKRVVLDAGHGGSDPGATAADLLEKEITLDINQRLRALLEANGFDVVVTRDADRTVALKDRAQLANESRSDIFVSIHVNAIEKHTESRGIETYYLGAAPDAAVTALAAAENRVSGYSFADMRKLLEGVYADARRDESHQLASSVQQKLFATLQKDDPGLENWGVKRAPFLVLVATDMPAVLAEVGCISNAKEAAMLRRPDYRQKIANALFEGIRTYAGVTDAPLKKGSQQNG